MTKISAAGLVIREQNIGEYDRLITVLTARHGLIRAFSRGAKKAKSKKLSATALLTYSDFTFTKTKDTYAVEDAVAKEVFFELREDIVKTALAQYICELAYEFCDQDYESEEILRLFLNSLYFLKEGKKSPLFIKSVTELRLLSLSGYMPALVACDECGEYETERMSFCPHSGKLYCSSCVPPQYSVGLSLSVVRAMRHIVFSDFDKIFSFSLSQKSESELSKVCESYLLSQTSRKFKTLDFFKSLYL